MFDTNSKISFIPKSPLVREEDAFRSRPRSVFAIIASFVFVVSVAAYFGLSFYHRALADNVNQVTNEIESLKKDFDRPEIQDARVFRARADSARVLLEDHITMRPLFHFLEQYTVERIFYTEFSFVRDRESSPVLDLKGEAPDYASLAYQMDVFREKKELLSTSLSDLTLTKTGTVTFSLSLVFAPDFLSYEKSTREISFSGEMVTPSVGIRTTATPLLGMVTASASTTENTNPLLDIATTSDGALGVGENNEESSGIVTCEPPLVRIIQEDGTVMCVVSEIPQGTTIEKIKSFLLWIKFW